MAVNMISSGFLLLVLAAGVQSAIKELGAGCATGASADTCVSPLAELVCDAPPSGSGGLCRVKVGQPCKKAGGLCVVGALCNAATDICECATGYSPAPAGTGQCKITANGYYSACTSSNANTACTATGLKNALATDCSADGGCQCATATPVPDYVTAGGICIALTNAVVGQTCTVVNAATDCGTNGVSHMSCVALKCACDTGYFPTKTPGGTCVPNTASTVGVTCTVGTGSECTGQNEECATSPCACKTGFTSKPGGVCYAAWGTKQGSCSVDGDCTGTAGATKCTAVASAPKTCKTALAVGVACTANPTTEACGTGLVCDTTCKTELTTVGADCSVANTKCTTGLTCGADNKCKLADDYNGGACTTVPATAFARGSCTSGTNTVCGAATGAAGICVCQQGYEGVAPKACAITANMFGASCTTGTVNTKGTCGDVSLVCSATTGGTCVCATAAGYSGGSNGDVCKSANSLGGACTSGSCTDTNAECSGSVCRCKTDYVQSFFTSKCVLGAGGTTDCTGLTCVEGSTCTGTTPRCTCDTGKAPWTVNTKICLPSTANVLGGTCTITTTEAANTEKGTCTDANGRCRRDIGFCTCKDGYTASNFGQTCHASDAMMITTSSLLITLAAVISQLFVR